MLLGFVMFCCCFRLDLVMFRIFLACSLKTCSGLLKLLVPYREVFHEDTYYELLK